MSTRAVVYGVLTAYRRVVGVHESESDDRGAVCTQHHSALRHADAACISIGAGRDSVRSHFVQHRFLFLSHPPVDLVT
jgi:hypothetical protein